MSATTDAYSGNPLLTALADLVNSYDEDTQRVSLVAIKAAREVLAGRLPNWWQEIVDA